MCPPSFDCYEFLPSIGLSGGVIIIWKSSLFHGSLIFQNAYAISVEFISKHNDAHWILTNVYAPCTYAGKHEFLQWFSDIQMPDDVNWLIVGDVNWLIVGDFNLCRSPEDRNRPGGDLSEMFLFNEAISALGLIELPLKGRRFTWSNKQQAPLLERIDWFFTSASWTTFYPSTIAFPLINETSDHVPCIISIFTYIPKHFLFHFENYWLEHTDFLYVVEQAWSTPVHASDAAKIITAKFKNLRMALKTWKRSLSNLKTNIANVKLLLGFFCLMEEFRDLSIVEWNFKVILERKLQTLLHHQRFYWKLRGTIKWVKLGDAPRKFFHANATIKYRKNLITMLEDDTRATLVDHQAKAKLI